MDKAKRKIKLPKVVLATSTLYAPAEKVRPRLAIRLAVEAKRRGYLLVVVDGGKSDAFRRELKRYGAHVYKQKKKGFGPARRQAYKETIRIAGKNAIVVGIEPEKYTLIKELPKITKPALEQKADLVIPRRKTLASYPPEQEYAERLINLVVAYLTNKEFDFPFGPFVMGPKAQPLFLNYKREYGDSWDSQQIPKFRAIKMGLRVIDVPVNYVHPKEQTLAETGNMDFFRKRIEQLQNQFSSFIKENKLFSNKN